MESAIPHRWTPVETLFAICLVLGLVTTGYLWRRDRRALPARPPGPRPVRPGDVLQHLGQDYLVEQVTQFEEPGRPQLLCRLSGGRWLWVRRPCPPDPDDELWLLDEADVAPEGGAPEELWHGPLRYRLHARFSVEVAYTLPPGPAHRWERALEYRSVGGARLLLLGGPEGARGYVGEALPDGDAAILPGS